MRATGPTGGLTRLVRVVALGGSSLVIAAGAHLLGGGRLPSAGVLGVVAFLLGLSSVVLTARRCRLPVLMAVLVPQQALLHVLFDTAARAGSGCGVAMSGMGHGPAPVPVATCGSMGSMAVPGWAMWVTHLVAVALTAAVLARGEAWLWRVGDAIAQASTARPSAWPSAGPAPVTASATASLPPLLVFSSANPRGSAPWSWDSFRRACLSRPTPGEAGPPGAVRVRPARVRHSTRIRWDLFMTTVVSPAARRWGARAGAVALLAAALSLAGAGAASAHVRVFPDTTATGAFSELTFRVPNESATAGTVKLEVQLPQDTPFLDVSIRPVPGWSATTTEQALPKPMVLEGATITKAVRTVTWTAERGGAIAPGQYQEFALSVGPLPAPGTVLLPATQTYSDGQVVKWDEPWPSSGEEPEHPAPALVITAAAAPAPAADPATNAVTATRSDPVARGLGVGALVVAAAGLVVALTVRRRSAVRG